MAEGIVYLDVDDEITSAASRIRTAPGTKVALVVPYGSRIATSRMNFRLLSREAVMSNRRLSIVSGDAASRSLAASAGLPVYGSVGEYESALAAPAGNEAGADAPARDGATAAAAAAAAGALAASETVAALRPDMGAGGDALAARKSQRPKRPVPDETTSIATGIGGAAASATASAWTPPTTVEPDEHAEPNRALGRRVRAPVIAGLALVVLALVVAGVGAWVFLPSASITLIPRREAIPEIQLTVLADPTATAVDPATLTVPAIRVDVPVEASQTFTTTGTHVEETTAHGSVTFTNYDTSSGVSIPSGSIVSTESGTQFRTAATVVLQPAGIIPFSPTSDSVSVTAVRRGEGGNVPANTIRVVPAGQNPDLLKVNNPAMTSGGTHTETPQIRQAEIDKAMGILQASLTKAFADAVAAGAGAPPNTKVFPATATLPAAVPSPDPKTFLGKPLATFDLKLTGKGTVIAVDPTPVRTLAEMQLASKVAPNHRLVDGSTVIQVGEGAVSEDGQVAFDASASATQVAIVDPGVLPALVKGRTPAQARAALAPYGDATVTLWPDWVSTVTSIDGRLSIAVKEGPPSGADASPGASTAPTTPASPRPSSSAASGSSGVGGEPGSSPSPP